MSRPRAPLRVRRAYLLMGHATRLPGKFLLPVGGEPVAIRCHRILRGLGLEVTAVTVDPITLPGLPVLRDRRDAGPLGGVATILETTEEPFFLFGGDMPWLDAPSVERMRSVFDGRSMVPVGPDGKWEVLHAIYSDLDRGVVEALVGRRAGVKDLVDRLASAGRVKFLPPGFLDPKSFTDLDTPEDYARIQSSK